MRGLATGLGVLLVTLLLLAAIEGGLRLAGFSVPLASSADRILSLPLFEAANAPDGAPVMRRRGLPVSFRRDKPANGYRVFVIGESSVYGFPLGAEFAFPRFLQDRLAAANPKRTVEVLNAGVPGIGSWHALQVVEELVHDQPDAFVIYLGHNEFSVTRPAGSTAGTWQRTLAPLRFYQLAIAAQQAWSRWWKGPVDETRLTKRRDPWDEVRERARGKASLSNDQRTQIFARYRSTMRDIVATARRSGAHVVLASVAQNLADFPPAASRHRRNLSDAQRSRWRTLVEQADTLLSAGKNGPALSVLETAQKLDSTPAILHYMRGHCLEALGRFDEAHAAYAQASDLDAVPAGAPSGVNRIIEEVATETGVSFVDVAAALRDASPHGLVGEEMFTDQVHPTVAGHAEIARVVARALGAEGNEGAPDVAALVAAHPELRKLTAQANVLLAMMLGRYDQAEAEIDAHIAEFSDLEKLRPMVEKLRTQDPERSWSDLPAEAG